jgi:hypothetical protein
MLRINDYRTRRLQSVSWLLNLLSGLVAVLISAALLHFGGAPEATPQDQTPAAQSDHTRMPEAAPAEDEASRHG